MIFPLQLLGCIRWAVVPLGGSAECASAIESSSSRRGPSLQAFTPFGGLLPGSPKKGNANGAESIFDLAGPTLKTTLCQIRALVGRMINKQRFSVVTLLREVGFYVIVVAFTSLPLLVVDSKPFSSLQIALLQG